MSCYFPWTPRGDGSAVRPLACGKCIGCKLRRAQELATRAMHEASLYKVNSFILLTYRDAPFSLEHFDFQCFMKRLRARLRVRVRYFMCGEYGKPSVDNGFTYRPHFHAIIFNWWPDDAVYFKQSPSGHPLYRSKVLEETWKLGHCSVGHVSFDAARYIAKYCTKKLTYMGEDGYSDINVETGEMRFRAPEYGRMSTGGGVKNGNRGMGYNWYRRFGSDVYPDGKCVIRDGVICRAPKYYDKLYRAGGFGDMMLLSGRRRVEGLKMFPESMPDRLEAREAVVRAQLNVVK